MRLRKKNIITYVVIIAFLVIGVSIVGGKGFINGANKENTVVSVPENKVSVKVQLVKTLQKTVAMSYKATLEPSEEGIVSSKMGGKVVDILFENGKTVSKGDPLVRIDDQDIKNNIASTQAQLTVTQTQLKSSENQLLSAQKGLQKLEINLDNAQRSYDRTKELFDQGVATQVEFENAETAVKVAKSDIESAKISIETSRLAVETAKASLNSVKTSIKTLNDSLANTVIRAPMNGTIDEKSISIGQFISAGTVLAKVKNISSLNAVIQVEQGNLKYVKEGMKAQIKIDDMESDPIEGVLKNIDIAADSNARVFRCKIQIDNSKGLFHPGVFAEVKLINDQKYEAMVVPLQALNGSEGNYSIFVFKNGKAQKVSVSIGEISNDTAEIISGLDKDDSIIITNLSILQDGDPVSTAE